MRTRYKKEFKITIYILEKVPKELTVPKAVDAVVGKICSFFLMLFLSAAISQVSAQDIPEDELQARINTYFDNFGVTVIYPTIDYTKRLSPNTSVSASYLTDIISSASMRSLFKVDGVTSATSNTHGGQDNIPDEWRHQLSVGVMQKVVEGIFSLSGMYSIEHDYSSKSIFSSINYPFAKKNTYLTLTAAGSFDKIFPQNRYWTKNKNTYSFSIALSQILSKNIITQLDASYINVSGYLFDGYQVVMIYNEKTNAFLTLDPVYPDRRIRRAVGLRTNIGLTNNITLQPGYRYYWDSWGIKSNTIYGILSDNFSDIFAGSPEFREYLQTAAYFFKPVYYSIERFMAVDGQLNSGYSNELDFNITLRGKKNSFFLKNENIQLIASLGFYKRHYDSPEWHSGYLNLYAFLFSIGMRYHL